jgi:polysaccharide deacetylase family protein (PEP-CTERM system associated)
LAVIRHYFTVDVEEHFQVRALAPWVARERWDSLESRVARNVDRLLQLLARHGATGTFFTLGWVAERQPAMIKAIAAAGHEVASHGYDHRRVVELEPDAFREQVRRTKSVLESLSGRPCLGYRAPNYSIVAGWEWALDVLVEEGYRYDSSLFPITRPGYGYAGGGRDPYWLERPAGRLLEVPPTTLRRAGLNLPAAGGAYFRLLPSALVRAALRDAERRGQPGTFYLHPWEIDPDQPRFQVPLLTRVRHYGGLARTSGRLERLLGEFRFVSISEGLAAYGAAAA